MLNKETNKYEGVIYSYTLNGKQYIGKTSMEQRKRMGKHKFEAFTKKTNTAFARAIRKYGWEETAKSYKVVETVVADTKAEMLLELSKRETYYILRFNTVVPNGYNLYATSDYSEKTYGDKVGMYKKVSQSLKGKYMNCESTSRKVYCVEMDKWFPSISEASRVTGIPHTSISKCANGTNCNGGGYTWTYGAKKGRASKRENKKIRCKETGEIFDSVYSLAKLLHEKNPERTTNNIYQGLKTSVKKGWRCEGFHWEIA